MISDMGFYAIVKTKEDNINLEIKDNKGKTYTSDIRLLNLFDEEDDLFFLVTSNIKYDNFESFTIYNTKYKSKIINLRSK